MWPGDTSALTRQPEAQAPPRLEPQGQQGQDWKEAVPSPTALSCLLPLSSGLPRVVVRGRLPPHKGPSTGSSWLGARTPVQTFLIQDQELQPVSCPTQCPELPIKDDV